MKIYINLDYEDLYRPRLQRIIIQVIEIYCNLVMETYILTLAVKIYINLYRL